MADRRRIPGLWRRRRRGASEPKAFLPLKQGGGGVAKARPGRGVRHVVAERWDEAEDWADRAVPARRTVNSGGGIAWLNQQFGR